MTKVYEADITDFVLDDHNANRGTERGSKEIEQSLRDLGAGRSIVVDRTGKIPAGNKTVQAAVKAGITKAIVIETKGDAIIVHKRNDWDLDDPDVNNPARQYAYRDNLTQVHSFEIDPAQVRFDLDMGMDLSAVFETSELDAILAELEGEGSGDAPEQARQTLAERFVVPPFSVLDARQGYWQERKRAWIALGIESELGRGEAVTWGIAPSGEGTGKYSDKSYTDAAAKAKASQFGRCFGQDLMRGENPNFGR